MSRHFPDWLTAYMEHTSLSEAPAQFHLWSGIFTIAGALRRRVWIDQRIFQWTPNFYIILVGPPGIATKSTAMNTGLGLLRRIAGKTSSTEGIKIGPQSITWQALVPALADALDVVRVRNEKGEEELHEMSCLTMFVSELGTFLKPDTDGLIDMLTGLWDGQKGTMDHVTKTQGDSVAKNPWLNIMGCTTPSWLQNNFPEHMIGGGLTSRCVFIYGAHKRHLVAYPGRHIKPLDFAQNEQLLVEDLLQIASLFGEYQLTDEAYEWGDNWYKEHWGEGTSELHSSRYEGYRARKQTLIHKLAMVLAASSSSKLIVDKSHLSMANELIAHAEPQMKKVFESIGVVDEARHMKEITAYVRSFKILTAQQLWRLCMNVMSRQNFNAAVAAAIEARTLVLTTYKGERAIMLAKEE